MASDGAAMHVPPGYTTVFPYIFAGDAHAYLTFLRAGLDGEIVERKAAPDGGVANAVVRIGDTMVMVSSATPDWPATRSTYYRYVADADAAMARAIAAGGAEIMAVADRPYGDRQGGVRDPEGNIWWLSQRLHAGPYREA